MIQNDLQTLLDKFREGTLTDSERSELERLSHKDEVFSAARGQATGIMRRRVALAVSALLICGAGIWAVLPGHTQGPLMAENTVTIPEAPEEVREVVAPEAIVEPAPMVAEAHESGQRSVVSNQKVRPDEVRPAAKPVDEPVVVCNNQCDADSVISDIRKFLAYDEGVNF